MPCHALVVGLFSTLLQVMFDESTCGKPSIKRNSVPIAIKFTGKPFRDTGEFLSLIIEPSFLHPRLQRINNPPIQSHSAFIRSTHVCCKHLWMAQYIQDDSPHGVLIAVHWMKDIAWVDLVPSDFLCRSVPRKQSYPGAVFSAPTIRQTRTHLCSLHVQYYWQVQKDEVIFGDHTVMHHGLPRNRDIDRANDLALCTDDHMLYIIPQWRIDSGMQFASVRIKVGVCRQPAWQGSTEIGACYCLKRRIQLYWEISAFDQRQSFSSMKYNIGIGDPTAKL